MRTVKALPHCVTADFFMTLRSAAEGFDNQSLSRLFFDRSLFDRVTRSDADATHRLRSKYQTDLATPQTAGAAEVTADSPAGMPPTRTRFFGVFP